MIKPQSIASVAFSFLLLTSTLVFGQTTTVAVAANLKEAFISIIAANPTFKIDEIKIIYGSSGNLFPLTNNIHLSYLNKAKQSIKAKYMPMAKLS